MSTICDNQTNPEWIINKAGSLVKSLSNTVSSINTMSRQEAGNARTVQLLKETANMQKVFDAFILHTKSLHVHLNSLIDAVKCYDEMSENLNDQYDSTSQTALGHVYLSFHKLMECVNLVTVYMSVVADSESVIDYTDGSNLDITINLLHYVNDSNLNYNINHGSGDDKRIKLKYSLVNFISNLQTLNILLNNWVNGSFYTNLNTSDLGKGLKSWLEANKVENTAGNAGFSADSDFSEPTKTNLDLNFNDNDISLVVIELDNAGNPIPEKTYNLKLLYQKDENDDNSFLEVTFNEDKKVYQYQDVNADGTPAVDNQNNPVFVDISIDKVVVKFEDDGQEESYLQVVGGDDFKQSLTELSGLLLTVLKPVQITNFLREFVNHFSDDLHLLDIQTAIADSMVHCLDMHGSINLTTVFSPENVETVGESDAGHSAHFEC